MSSNQFGHTETYQRKLSANTKDKGKRWTVKGIVGEAGREPEYSDHVESPQEPTVIRGIHPREIEARLDEYLESNKVMIQTKNGTQERKVRDDAHVLLATVYSWPQHADYYDEKRLMDWIDDTVQFHDREFGEAVSVVLHLDEGFPHIHVYNMSNNARAELHPGHVAKSKAGEDIKARQSLGEKKDQKANSKEMNDAYKQAMSAWQDRYFEAVGVKHGLDRLGPKRQRLTRQEHRDGKAARLALGDKIREAEARADSLNESAGVAEAELNSAKSELSDLNAKISLLSENKRRGEALIVKYKTELSALSEARSEQSKELKKIEKRIAVSAGVVNVFRSVFRRAFKIETETEKQLRLEVSDYKNQAKELRAWGASNKEKEKKLLDEVRSARSNSLKMGREYDTQLSTYEQQIENLKTSLNAEKNDNKNLRDHQSLKSNAPQLVKKN